MDVLVTGGAGYVGSHTVQGLDEAGFRPVILDNLSEGHRESLLTGEFIHGDISDDVLLGSLFQKYRFEAVLHFAARCYVGESVTDPLLYYAENVGRVLPLLQEMLRNGVKKFVLSSSCAVYGDPVSLPLKEDHPRNPVNPYGRTKMILEDILADCSRAYGLRSVSLRYFNAAGASLDGRIGESHYPETHLIPRVLQVAANELGSVQVYGHDYDTVDGTAVRDYVHVLDLAAGHIRALEWLNKGSDSAVFNLGTGQGITVRQIIDAASRVTGREIVFGLSERRAGDPPVLVADASRALRELGWKPLYSDLDMILESAWKWQRNRRF